MSASLQQDDDRVIYALIRSMYDADGAVPSRREWERLRSAVQRRRIHWGVRIAICAGALAVTVISTGRPSPAPVARAPVAVVAAPVVPVPIPAVVSPAPVAEAPVRVARADPAAVRRWRARVKAWRARARARRALAAQAAAPAIEAVAPVAVAVAAATPAVVDNRRPMTVAAVRSTLPVQESDRPSGEDSSHDANRAATGPDGREKEALDAIRTLRLR
ncbi:hypothetical protein [Sphingomonas carotinifaciens]|uniref:Uncharacterized protein n=1 Tax=Sphingomonas carotinifaciens TaxID=1166323 RepID=A0A1G7NKS6_9SPHN|nr:hypothetical protein [Sphingomonas carotinifaciens]MBB4087044.1 hypothetical protein [Sphingomonas carotinifaciens]SDF74551.1 hypothetical protein SAMN05216557_105201 [Sphingomonas carotinifaciens]